MLEVVSILLAGVAAGTINTIVGSGTLITFPVLLAFGYPPVVANVSNTIGLVPGSLSGAYGYRHELAGQGRRAVRLGAASLVGGTLGAVALLLLPASAFSAIVPGFIAIALALVLFQPRLARHLAQRGHATARDGGLLALTAIFAAGLYGGYFGAAQGILLLAILGLALTEDLQRINALKNVLALIVNLVAGVIFVFVAHVAWAPALLLMGGSAAGGQLGARVGRRLPAAALRGFIVAVGLVAIAQLVLR